MASSCVCDAGAACACFGGVVTSDLLPRMPEEVREPLLGPSTAEGRPESSDNDHAVVIPHSPPGAAGARTTTWLLVTAIMLSDMFGLGTLSLPGDFARLGWAPAVTATLLLAAGGIYTGSLYQRLSLRVPAAKVFDQIGQEAHGKWGSVSVYLTIYMAILGEPVMFHLVCVESLRQMLYMYNLQPLVASLAVTCLILPLSQLSHMEDVAWVSIMGTVGMLVVVVVIVVQLLVLFATNPDARGPTEVVTTGSLQSATIGFLDIAFAFGGQINWMRYITTMRHRQHFSRAASITIASISVVYMIVGTVGYGIYGINVDIHNPITSVLPKGVWFIVMNSGLFLHVIVTYQIMVNVWSASLLEIVMPRRWEKLSHKGGWDYHLLWLCVTSACIALSAWVSYTFPFFSLVMAVLASVGDLMSMFGFPCMFAIKLLKLSRLERGVCWVLASVTVVLSGVGFVIALQQLIAAYMDSKGG